jgi:ribonuclease VapC
MRLHINGPFDFSYALAISTGEPLLFTGDDFVHTDVATVDPGSA